MPVTVVGEEEEGVEVTVMEVVVMVARTILGVNPKLYKLYLSFAVRVKDCLPPQGSDFHYDAEP